MFVKRKEYDKLRADNIGIKLQLKEMYSNYELLKSENAKLKDTNYKLTDQNNTLILWIKTILNDVVDICDTNNKCKISIPVYKDRTSWYMDKQIYEVKEIITVPEIQFTIFKKMYEEEFKRSKEGEI